MNKKINTFIKYVCSTNCPQHDKSKLINSIQAKFNLTKDRTVFYCSYFAVRFSYSKSGSFSNTVLSLSALQKYDHIPFFVVLVSAKNNNKIFLANTSFLTKISHSSKQLSMTNIKGSFNGSDIIKKYHEIENTGDNYEKLFAFHQGFSWEENFERLVGTTLEITPTNKKVEITNLEKRNYFNL